MRGSMGGMTPRRNIGGGRPAAAGRNGDFGVRWGVTSLEPESGDDFNSGTYLYFEKP